LFRKEGKKGLGPGCLEKKQKGGEKKGIVIDAFFSRKKKTRPPAFLTFP